MSIYAKRVEELGTLALKQYGILVMAAIIKDLEQAKKEIDDSTVITFQLSESILAKIAEDKNIKTVIFAQTEENHNLLVEYKANQIASQFRKVQWQRALYALSFLTLVFLSGMWLGLKLL